MPSFPSQKKTFFYRRETMDWSLCSDVKIFYLRKNYPKMFRPKHTMNALLKKTTNASCCRQDCISRERLFMSSCESKKKWKTISLLSPIFHEIYSLEKNRVCTQDLHSFSNHLMLTKYNRRILIWFHRVTS